MQIHLIAIGQKLDAWVNEGFKEYAKRLPPECKLNLVEIAAGKRGKNADIERIMRDEGERMMSAIPARTHVVALDIQGTQWSTERLSTELHNWMSSGQDIAMLVGGPDGLSPDCLALARQRWSLSALTLPHPLVRIVIAEQIYRAWSLSKGHPYHR